VPVADMKLPGSFFRRSLGGVALPMGHGYMGWGDPPQLGQPAVTVCIFLRIILHMHTYFYEYTYTNN